MLRGRLTRISGMLRGLRGARRGMRRGLRGMRDIRFGNRHGFRAGEVRKMEPQLVSRKARANRVTQRQVLGVSRLFAVCNGGGVSPASNPFRKFLWHMPKIAKMGVIAVPCRTPMIVFRSRLLLTVSRLCPKSIRRGARKNWIKLRKIIYICLVLLTETGCYLVNLGSLFKALGDIPWAVFQGNFCRNSKN